MVERIAMVTYLNGMHIVSEPNGNYVKYSDYATLAAAARRLVEAKKWTDEVRDAALNYECNYDGDVEASETLDKAWEDFDAALAEVEALLKEGE